MWVGSETRILTTLHEALRSSLSLPIALIDLAVTIHIRDFSVHPLQLLNHLPPHRRHRGRLILGVLRA